MNLTEPIFTTNDVKQPKDTKQKTHSKYFGNSFAQNQIVLLKIKL